MTPLDAVDNVRLLSEMKSCVHAAISPCFTPVQKAGRLSHLLTDASIDITYKCKNDSVGEGGGGGGTRGGHGGTAAVRHQFYYQLSTVFI